MHLRLRFHKILIEKYLIFFSGRTLWDFNKLLWLRDRLSFFFAARLAQYILYGGRWYVTHNLVPWQESLERKKK